MVIPAADSVQFTGRVPVILLEGRLPVLDTPLAQALGLRDGQVVRPTVEVRDGQVTLMLQGQAIALPAQLRIAAGDRPDWQVSLDGRGRATLTPLGGAAASGLAEGDALGVPASPVSAGATAGRVEQLALRPTAALALESLLQPGALLALAQAAARSDLGAQVARAVGAWPQLGALTPEGLRKLVRQSAAGPEAGLARGEAVGGGLKSLLRALVEDTTLAPPDTQALVRDALDDLESRQLQGAMAQVDGRESVFSMLLPFADAEPVNLRWSQARQAAADGRRAPWVVELHTDSSRFGQVWMRTRISDRADVDLVMWAEQADLAARARAGGASLAAWLGEAGLRMAGLQVIHGRRPALESDVPMELGSGRLVDLQA